MISICYTLKNTWDGLLHSSSSWKDYPSNFLARWDFFLQPLKHHRCYWGNVCMFQSTVMPQQILAWAWVCFCLFFIIVSDFCLFFIIISDFLALLFCFLLITFEKNCYQLSCVHCMILLHLHRQPTSLHLLMLLLCCITLSLSSTTIIHKIIGNRNFEKNLFSYWHCLAYTIRTRIMWKLRGLEF